MGRRKIPISLWLFGACLSVVGLTLAISGLYLISLGGSAYYCTFGLLLMVSGALVGRRRASGAWVYLAAFSLTLGWAFWEVGVDVWRLLPRLDGPIALGLIFFTPWIRRGLSRSPARTQPSGGFARGLLQSAAAVVVAFAGLGAVIADQPGPAPIKPAIRSAPSEWRHYGNTLQGQRYAPLAQLNAETVDKLQIAWTFHTGETGKDRAATTFEATPIKVRDTLYLCTPRNVVVALDAETGRQRWRYDPRAQLERNYVLTCRGVSYHEAATGEANACRRRILTGTGDARLIALNADTGEPCSEFGDNGVVDLKRGLGHVEPGHYLVTSAPTIVSNLVVTGGQVLDRSSDPPSGVVRAFDVTSGALVWNWDASRPEQTAPLADGDLYTRASPNSWGPASVDEALGLIYLPTGVQKPGAWSGNRNPVGDQFSSAIVALEVATGRLRWVYQTVHHDVWDLDVGAQPTLVDINTAAGMRQALLAVTKRGDIFVLDRRTGEALVPAPERSVPRNGPPGERLAPTQPFSELSFQPAPLTEADMWGVSPIDQLWCRIQFRQYRYEGIFTPQTPEGEGSLIYPGHYGVFNWGGVAVDQARQLVVVAPNYVGYYSHLAPAKQPYARVASLQSGRRDGGTEAPPSSPSPFSVEFGAFLSPLGIPCNAPPWGELAAVDLSTNQVIWRRSLGTTRDRAPLGLPLPLGVPTLGGPVATKSGLVFIAGTLDNYLRAFNIFTGKELWRGRLPAGGQATPMTYISERSGRQFVVIAAGGHSGIGTTRGDSVIAFALP